MRWTVLISSILASFVLAAAVSRLSNPSLCRSSSLVQRIDILTLTGHTDVPRCVERSNSIDAAVNKKIVESEAIFQTLSRLLGRTKAKWIPILMRVDLAQPYRFEVGDGIISIGRHFLEIDGVVQRSLIASFVEQNTGIMRSRLESEILADILEIILTGSIQFQDPVSQRSIRSSLDIEKSIDSTFQSRQGWCHSPWRFISETSVCLSEEDQAALKKTTGEEPLVIAQQSLRGLIARSLLTVLPSLGVADRIGLLKRFVEAVRSESLFLTNEGLSIPGDFFKSAKIVLLRLQVPFPKLEGQAKNDELSLLAPKLRIFAPIRQIEASRDLGWEAMTRSDVRIEWALPNGRALTPLGPVFKLPKISDASEHAVVLTCRAPTIGQLETVNSTDQKILIVKRCSPQQDLNLVSYIDGEIRRFRLKNPSMTFIHISRATIELAKKFGVRSGDRLNFEKPFGNLPRAEAGLLTSDIVVGK